MPHVPRRLLGAAALLVCCGSAAACAAGSEPDDTGGSTSVTSSVSSSTGIMGPSTPMEAYALSCAECHGADGSGTKDGPQILNPVHDFATYTTRTGRNEMGYPDPMDPYTAADVTDEHLAGILTWLSEAPHPTDGPGLFVRFCGNCHGADAAGGRVGKDVRGEDLEEVEEIVREGHHLGDFADREEYMPKWSTAELSNVEVQAIASYLATLGGGDDD